MAVFFFTERHAYVRLSSPYSNPLSSTKVIMAPHCHQPWILHSPLLVSLRSAHTRPVWKCHLLPALFLTDRIQFTIENSMQHQKNLVSILLILDFIILWYFVSWNIKWGWDFFNKCCLRWESPKYCASFTTKFGENRMSIHSQGKRLAPMEYQPGSAVSPCCGGKEIRNWRRGTEINEGGRSDET